MSADQREEKNDSKMVGALVHRLLNSFESNTGGARLRVDKGVVHTLRGMHVAICPLTVCSWASCVWTSQAHHCQGCCLDILLPVMLCMSGTSDCWDIMLY